MEEERSGDEGRVADRTGERYDVIPATIASFVSRMANEASDVAKRTSHAVIKSTPPPRQLRTPQSHSQDEKSELERARRQAGLGANAHWLQRSVSVCVPLGERTGYAQQRWWA